MIDIQPGDVVTHLNGNVGIVQSEPFQPSGWLGQAWWRVIVEWEEDGDMYQMGWCCDAIVEIERNGNVIGQQLSLWEAEAV